MWRIKLINYLYCYLYSNCVNKKISVYYENIKQYERENIENIDFNIEVDTKIFKDGVKKTVIDTGEVIENLYVDAKISFVDAYLPVNEKTYILLL